MLHRPAKNQKHKTPRLLRIGFFVLAGFLIIFSFPSTAYAWPVWLSGPSAIFAAIFSTILGWLASLIGILAEWLMVVINVKIEGTAPVIHDGWVITRDFANMFFIVALIFMAFGTIFGVDKYKFSSLIAKFLIVALLINFSLTIGGLILDSSQLMSNIFLTSIGNISTTLGQVLVPGNLVVKTNGTAATDSQGRPIIKTDEGIQGQLQKGAFDLFFSIILLCIVIFSLIVALFMALVRVPILWALLIMAPLAWITYILPTTRAVWTKWWKMFLGWALFMPIFLFFLFFGLYFLEKGQNALIGFQATNSQALGADFPIQYVFFYILVGIFLIGGTTTALKFSMFAGTGITEMAGKARFAANRLPFFSQVRQVGVAAKMRQQELGEHGFRNKFLNRFVYGGARGERRATEWIAGEMLRSQKYSKSARHRRQTIERAKEMEEENLSPAELRNLQKSNRPGTIEHDAAHEVLLRKKAADLDGMIRTAQAYGQYSEADKRGYLQRIEANILEKAKDDTLTDDFKSLDKAAEALREILEMYQFDPLEQHRIFKEVAKTNAALAARISDVLVDKQNKLIRRQPTRDLYAGSSVNFIAEQSQIKMRKDNFELLAPEVRDEIKKAVLSWAGSEKKKPDGTTDWDRGAIKSLLKTRDLAGDSRQRLKDWFNSAGAEITEEIEPGIPPGTP